MQTAANFLESLILNNITVTIQVTYDTTLGTSAEGGDLFGQMVPYTTLRAALASHETSGADQTFVDSLPTASLISGVNGSGAPVTVSSFWVPSAIGKVLGLISATNDPFDEFYSNSTIQTLTSVDKELLDVLGFDVTLPTIVIADNGTTSLTQAGTHFFLYADSNPGTGPSLKYFGADVVAGEFGP